MLEITVDAKQVERLFDAVKTATHSDSQRMFLRQIALPFLQDRAAQRFASGGDDASGPWRPLSGTTQRLREWQIKGGMRGKATTGGKPVRGRGLADVSAAKPINVRTGNLRAFVLSSFAIEQWDRATDLTMPNPRGPKPLMSKFQRAQEGGIVRLPVSRSPRPFRARPVLALGGTDKAALDDLAGDWFTEMIRAHA